MANTLYGKLLNETEIVITDELSLEEAYNTLYEIVTRLQDMDDFDNNLLSLVHKTIDEGASFKTAMSEAIDAGYEFADSDYFKDVLNSCEGELKEIFDKVIKAKNPAEDWTTEIRYLAENTTLNYNGKDYNLKELRDLVEKGVTD